MADTSLTPILMQGFIYITLFATTIYSLIYGYHWFSYGTSKRTSTVTLIVFLVGAVVLIGTMLSAYLLI